MVIKTLFIKPHRTLGDAKEKITHRADDYDRIERHEMANFDPRIMTV